MERRALLVLLLFPVVVLILASAQEQETIQEWHKDIAEGVYVKDLNDRQFKAVTRNQNTRGSYTLLLLFTDRSNLQCPACRLMEEQVRSVASQYYETQKGDNATLLFGKVNAETCRSAFIEFDMQRYPALLRVPPRLYGPFNVQRDTFSITHFSIQDPLMLVNWIYEVCDEKVSYRRPEPAQSYRWILPVCVGVLFCFTLWAKRHSLTGNMMYCFCLLAYALVLSGVIFNAIRAPPLYGHSSRTRSIQIIATNAVRSQYIGEGFLLAILHVWMAGLWVILTKAHQARGYINVAVALFVMVLLFGTFNVICIIFGQKNRSYPFYFTPSGSLPSLTIDL